MYNTKIIASLLLSMLLLSGCAMFGSKRTDQKLEREVSALMLDQQLYETRLSLAEDRIIALQTHLGAGQGRSFGYEKKHNPAEIKVKAAPKAKTTGKMPLKMSAAASASSLAEYKAARAAFTACNYKQAESLFKDFGGKYPTDPLAANAGYWLGESYYCQGRYDEAILAFQAVTRQYPKHDKAAAALLKTAYSYERLADKPNARFYLEQLLENYPKSESSSLAQAALKRI